MPDRGAGQCKENAEMLRYSMTILLFAGVGFCQASPSAKEIMENYSKNRSTYDSFIGKCQYCEEYELTPLSEKRPSRKGTSLNREEFRFDGVRGCYIDYAWGKPSPDGPYVPEGNPWFTYMLTANDGQEYWYGRAGNSDIGHVDLDRTMHAANRGEEMLAYVFRGGTAMGYFYGDIERVDRILQSSPGVTVRDKTEEVGGSQCYVIDATTDRGQYTLWMDPQRGYSIVKATVTRKAGDKMYGRVLGAGAQYLITVSNVESVNKDGVWVPTGGDSEFYSVLPGQRKSHQLARLREMDITINPDHDALGSFDPNAVIRDGVKVNVHNPGSNLVAQYIWQKGGKLVPYTSKPVPATRKPKGK
jgi:hypothetical protein